MKRIFVRMGAIVAAVAMLCAGSVLSAGQSAKADVTGTWAFTVESAAGTGLPTVTFKQEGEKLTGHYSSMFFGEAELTGTIKDLAIEFTVHAQVQDMKVELTFSATLDGKDSMKGKLSAGELGDGTFTGKRKG
jgi:hypothetical protein